MASPYRQWSLSRRQKKGFIIRPILVGVYFMFSFVSEPSPSVQVVQRMNLVGIHVSAKKAITRSAILVLDLAKQTIRALLRVGTECMRSSWLQISFSHLLSRPSYGTDSVQILRLSTRRISILTLVVISPEQHVYHFITLLC